MIHKSRTVLEITDWLGVFLIVGAYFGLVSGWLNATNLLYLWANILGSAAIALASWKKKDIQPVVLNLVWIAVALFGLSRAL